MICILKYWIFLCCDSGDFAKTSNSLCDQYQIIPCIEKWKFEWTSVSSTNIGLFSVVNSGDFEKNFVISCDQCNMLFNRFYSCHKTHIKGYGNKCKTKLSLLKIKIIFKNLNSSTQLRFNKIS